MTTHIILNCNSNNLKSLNDKSVHLIVTSPPYPMIEMWDECDRILVDNGFVCINIGDATRTIEENFQLFSNHTQIINYYLGKGYSVLPDIHWRKQSNTPNKYMGSGMYPAGAYLCDL